MKVAASATLLLSLLLLSSCASDSAQKSNADVKPSPSYSKYGNPGDLVGSHKLDRSSCVEVSEPEMLKCTVDYIIKNPTDEPIALKNVNVYAQVDGKTVKALSEQQGDGVSTLSQTWKPRESLKFSTDFTVPMASTIEKLFLTDKASIEDAEVIFEVYLLALPG